MQKKPNLTKKQFVEYINRIKATCDKDDMLSDAIEKACDKNTWVIGLYGSECNTMIDLLSLAMGLKVGTYDGNVIEYFIYDINFGKNYTPECYTEEDGSPIDISTAEKLYDYIISCLGEEVKNDNKDV